MELVEPETGTGSIDEHRTMHFEPMQLSPSQSSRVCEAPISSNVAVAAVAEVGPVTTPNHLKVKKKKTYYKKKVQKKLLYSHPLEECKKLINELLSSTHYDYAWPFYEPVDHIELKLNDYPQIITYPMDLKTVQKKLKERKYSSTAQFAADVRRIFSNCYLYNPPRHDVVKMCKKLESIFERSFLNIVDEPVKLKKPMFRAYDFDSTSDDEEEGETTLQIEEVSDTESERERKLIWYQNTLQMLRKKYAPPSQVEQARKKIVNNKIEKVQLTMPEVADASNAKTSNTTEKFIYTIVTRSIDKAEEGKNEPNRLDYLSVISESERSGNSSPASLQSIQLLNELSEEESNEKTK